MPTHLPWREGLSTVMHGFLKMQEEDGGDGAKVFLRSASETTGLSGVPSMYKVVWGRWKRRQASSPRDLPTKEAEDTQSIENGRCYCPQRRQKPLPRSQVGDWPGSSDLLPDN
jgi:hypothetical protein